MWIQVRPSSQISETSRKPVHMFRVHWSRMIGAVLSLAVLCAAVAAELSTVSLEHGFHLLYNLDFGGARDQFAEYQEQHADDPMGPVAEAAGLFLSVVDRLGVLRAGCVAA